MAVQCDGGGKDEVKTQFGTREGTYKVMTFSEYRPNRTGCITQTNHPVKVSFITLPDSSGNGDRICFNVGRELYFYMYKGLRKAADLTKPIDKRVYKGTFPTCHDFNEFTVSNKSVSLLVGFSAGQIQLIDPIKKELSKLYNEERLIDKSKVTCLKWLPGSPSHFLVAHGSGQMYVYNEDLPCGTTPPHYQVFKQGDGYAVYTCKTKSTRNPLYRWVIGEGALNEFAFSPCNRYLATVSQDGFLRVFNYDTMDLVGIARSYFGGLLCVCWSPDGKYVVTGGEDDLVTVWSFHERRVVARGYGHKSWVSVVAFDSYTTYYSDADARFDFSGSEDELVFHLPNSCGHAGSQNDCTANTNASTGNLANATITPNCTRSNSISNWPPVPPVSNSSTRALGNIVCYRFGSLGQDTQLCLWDLTEDVFKQPLGRSRTSILLGSTALPQTSTGTAKCCNSTGGGGNHSPNDQHRTSFTSHSLPNCVGKENAVADGNVSTTAGMGHKFATLSLATDRKERQAHQHTEKEHKRNFSLTSRSSDKNSVIKSNHTKNSGPTLPEDPVKLIGTPCCPRLDEVPFLEPLVRKKIAHERLTALVFREECIVTACQEGFVCTWARPGKVVSNKDCADDHGNPNLT